MRRFIAICVAALTRIDRGEIAACREVVKELLKKTGRNWRTDSEPILLIVEWGQEARPLAPVLRELVTADRVDPRTQLAAALSLVLIGGDQDAAGIKLIRDVVRTPDESYQRQQLLNLVGRLGPLAKPLLPEVRPLLSDADFGSLAKSVLAKVDETED